MDALIGHSGFVGSNLLAQRGFDRLYNSSNIDEIGGQSFDTLVCSAVQAKKWWANQNPEADWAGIEVLLRSIENIAARRFILISTVDVFADPVGYVEADADADDPRLAPYGKHRLLVEKWAVEHYANVTIVRLPALFGPGLKKNILFDLLHDNLVDQINPNSTFQWYPLPRLWADIETMQAAGIGCAQLVTEPVGTREIAERFFPTRTIAADGPTVGYDLRTIHAAEFGGSSYIMTAEQVMGSMAQWIAEEQV